MAPTPVSGRVLQVRRTAALGDVLCATFIARKLGERGARVIWQAHSNTHCILRRVPGLAGVIDPGTRTDVDLDGAYENDRMRRSKHFAQMFLEVANRQLARFGFALGERRNFAPRMVMECGECDPLLDQLVKYPGPWVMICPSSENHANRTVPNDIWRQTAIETPGTKFWLARTPCPTDVVDLGLRHFDDVIRAIACADLLVTVDTGPAHVAAALGVPAVVIEQASSPDWHLSDQRDWVKVSNPALDCLDCQDTLCRLPGVGQNAPPCQRIEPWRVASAVNLRLQAVTEDKISAVIVVHQPPAERLRHCLHCLADQVDEIVIVRDLTGRFPEGLEVPAKVRWVVKNEHDTGYGRKVNYGARHTNHAWILFINDDVYCNASSISKLREAVGEDTGLVAGILRYPDGTIQHGGTYRNGMGWGHIDLRARDCRFKAPLEMENVTGALALVRRQAHFDAEGFDEDYLLYCEDNDYNLRLRQAGWKIMFTPHSEAIHDEHQSTRHRPDTEKIMKQSQRLLAAKWGWFFEKNAGNQLGTFR